jgi:hypothetical protein
MKTEKYELSEVTDKLRSVGAPITMTVTEADEMRTAIVEAYVKWVEQHYSHENYDKENHKIVAQINRFKAALQHETWASNKAKDREDDRDHLIGQNKMFRTQLGLKNLDPDGANKKNYCMDPFTERNIKVAIDFDEVRATGGTCHSEDAALAYHIINLDTLHDDAYIIADISQGEYDSWRDELKAVLLEEDIASVRFKLKEETDARSETLSAVKRFLEDWAGERRSILELKQKILNQRLLERQITKLKQNNAELKGDLTSIVDGDFGLKSGEKGVL